MRKRLKNHFVPHEGNDYKPHFARGKNVIVFALLAISIFNLAFFLNSYLVKHPNLISAVITSVVIDLTNSNRLTGNIAPLTQNETLAYAAQLKANDMAEKSYFAHTSPDGKSPWYWFKEGGYEFLYAGENLAVNFNDSSEVVLAWMNSEGHRANIMNDKFTEIGIAMAPGYYNGRETIYVVQLFGKPAPKTLAIAENPAPGVPDVPIEDKTEDRVGQSSGNQNIEVLSENVDVIADNELFIAAQNNDYLAQEPSEETAGTLTNVETSAVTKVLTSPRVLLEYIYVVIGAIVLISLILLLVIEPRRQHPKHVVYVASLFALVAVLFFATKNYLFPVILIE